MKLNLIVHLFLCSLFSEQYNFPKGDSNHVWCWDFKSWLSQWPPEIKYISSVAVLRTDDVMSDGQNTLLWYPIEDWLL